MNAKSNTYAKPTLIFRSIRFLDWTHRRLYRHRVFRAFLPTKKALVLIFLILIPLLAVALYSAERTRTDSYLLTGPHGSTAALLGPQFADVLSDRLGFERWVFYSLTQDFSALESCGSLDNIAKLNQGRAQLAFVEDGLPMHLTTPPTCLLPPNHMQTRLPTKKEAVRLRAVMPLYLSPLHIISNKRLNYSDVHDIKPHSKVYIGPDGSGTSFVSQLVLKHEGILIDRKGENWDFQKAMQEVINGKIDVAFFLIALNSQEIKQLFDNPDLHLLTVDSAEALKLLAPYLEIIKIPASTYKVSSKGITTVGAKAILAASTELSDAEVYEITTKLSHHLHDLLKEIPLNVSKVSDGSVNLYYALHPGAIRFYEHNPPFFLDPHFLAGIGSYISILYASYVLTGQFLRHYRLHRFLHVVDRMIRLSKITGGAGGTGKSERHFHMVRVRMARLLREGRIKMDDIGIINEYIKSHS
jgi:TRAP-type uncharacterized transport system substrate-binding protein